MGRKAELGGAMSSVRDRSSSATGGRRARRKQPWRRQRRRAPWIIWGVVALLVAGVAAGVAIQRSRSVQPTEVVAPAHPLGPGGGEVLGRPSAPVLIEEYADFQCPACAALERELGPTVRRLTSEGRIRFVFHNFAFIGPESLRAASAATCAGDQGRFWPYHDLLFAEQGPENAGTLTTDRLIEFGKRVGVSDERFTRCVREDTYVPWVRQVTEEGSRRGVRGTPTLFRNGTQLSLDRVETPADLERAITTGTR
jgi:protein-disulfide isomerase